jgi:hypothetical protein
MRFSGVDGFELSRAAISARQLMYEDILELRKSDPRLVPVTTPSIPAVRMSRRLVGAVTAEIDSDHAHVESSVGMFGDWRKPNPIWELPWETLWHPGVRNLLAAGRCISVSDSLWDVTRVIPPCAVSGQACGTAAALAATLTPGSAANFPALNVAALQSALRNSGVRLFLHELTSGYEGL